MRKQETFQKERGIQELFGRYHRYNSKKNTMMGTIGIMGRTFWIEEMVRTWTQRSDVAGLAGSTGSPTGPAVR